MNRYAKTYFKSAIHDSAFSTQEDFIYLINQGVINLTRYRVRGKLHFVLNEDDQIRYRREELHVCYFWK